MGFSRQEYWSGLPFPSPGDLPNPGTEPGSPACLLPCRQILYCWSTGEVSGEVKTDMWIFDCVEPLTTALFRGQLYLLIKKKANRIMSQGIPVPPSPIQNDNEPGCTKESFIPYTFSLSPAWGHSVCEGSWRREHLRTWKRNKNRDPSQSTPSCLLLGGRISTRKSVQWGKDYSSVFLHPQLNPAPSAAATSLCLCLPGEATTASHLHLCAWAGPTVGEGKGHRHVTCFACWMLIRALQQCLLRWRW